MKRFIAIGLVIAAISIGALFSQPVITTNIAVLSGQQTATTSAINLGNNVIKTLCIKALAANAVNVYIGGLGVTTSTGMELAAGDSWCGNVSNTNSIYVVTGSSSPAVSWIATK